VIRRARVDDWEGALLLWREVDAQHAALAPAYFRPAARAAGEWRALLAAPEAAVFVAEGAGRGSAAVSGFAVVRVYDTPPDPAMVPLRRAHVETLVVARAQRRQGLGARLMEEVTSWARRQGAAEIVLTVWTGNQDAKGFYERLGYQELSRVLHAKV
jgi:diamine N-acetyltransferase